MDKRSVSALVSALFITSIFASALSIQPSRPNGTGYRTATGFMESPAAPTQRNSDPSTQSTVDWWPMFHHDLSHSGYSTSTAPNTNQTLWRYTRWGVGGSPAVAGGMVFVGCLDIGNVYALRALNASTGALVWSFVIGSGPTYLLSWSSPAVAGGTLFVGSDEDKVYALNASTGIFKWSYTTGGRVYSSPAVAGGVVFVDSYDYEVYALNATTGAYVWSYKTGDVLESSPAVAGGVVFVGSYDSKVYAFGTLPVTSIGGSVGITGYKLLFKETMSNSLSSPATIDYHWSFSVDKWNGTQWVAFGISGSSTPVMGYVIPALTTVDLPYYVYLLSPSAVAWCNWLRINFTFHWTSSGISYSTTYVAKLHVHPGDIAGVTPITLPYPGADGVANILDIGPIATNWLQNSTGADPLSGLGRADINYDGIVNILDIGPIATNWLSTWTNTPP